MLLSRRDCSPLHRVRSKGVAMEPLFHYVDSVRNKGWPSNPLIHYFYLTFLTNFLTNVS